MKGISKLLFVFAIVAIVAGFPAVAVFAAPAHGHFYQEAAPVLPSLQDFVKSVENLGGLALLFTAAINAAKRSGWLKDNQAPGASLVLNTLALVGLVTLQLIGRADVVPVIDQNAGTLATILTSVLALSFQLLVSRKGHEEAFAGLPVIGTSFSKRRAGEGVSILEEYAAK